MSLAERSATGQDEVPIAALTALLGAGHVVTDEGERRFYSTDVYRRADVDALVVLRPGTVEELAEAIGLCTRAGMAVVARGGGLSYTGGFLPVDARTATIDMARLDRIVAIDDVDMHVTVEAGCTWRALYEALKPRGLRTPYFGPMSGYGSTVGGALSQGSVFLGSTEHGTTADSTLALDVVLADGTLLRTGSAGSRFTDNPFFRNYGPDLAGPFLHDSGAFGFKARAVLRLIRAPSHAGYLTFTFAGHQEMLAAMSEVGRSGVAAECFGSDPYIWGMRLWDSDVAKDLKRLSGVVRSGSSLLAGVKDAVRIAAAGRRALGDVEYPMNVVVEGRSQAEVDHALGVVRKIAAAGREVEPTAPRAVRGTPFLPPDDLLGPKGQRWAPIHGIAPHSRVAALVDAIHAFFEARAERIAALGIEWGYVTFAIGAGAILVEPMLYWPGTREAYHERMISPRALAKLPPAVASAEAAAFVGEVRGDLTRLFMEQGCVHFQIGKTYRYMESRAEPQRALLEGLKRLVDPANRMNPGALGFGA